MLFIDEKGKFYSKKEVADISPSEIKIMGIHEYEKNPEKRLFSHMDDIIT